MHGDLERLYDKEFRKLKSGDILIVCGDFGYIYGDGKDQKINKSSFKKTLERAFLHQKSIG